MTDRSGYCWTRGTSSSFRPRWAGEIRSKSEIRTSLTGPRPARGRPVSFGLRVSDFFRISTFGFRPSDFEKESFSLITCFQTLEHVYDPMALCRGAFDLLHRGGALLLVCHDRRALQARVMGTRSPIFDIEHLQLFSRASLGYALRQAGYAEVTTHTVVNRYPISYWVKLFPLPARAVPRLTWAVVSPGSSSRALR